MRTCDTLSCFPTKVLMPIASSNDLILAGVQDILMALRNPTPGSPIDPLTDSHVATSKIVSELIPGLIIPVPKPILDPVSAPVPPLRVATPQTPSPLRVDPINPPAGPIIIPDDATIYPAPFRQLHSVKHSSLPIQIFPELKVHTTSQWTPILHLSSFQLRHLSNPSRHLQQHSKIAPVQEDAIVKNCLENNQRKRQHPTLQPPQETSKPSLTIGQSMAMPSNQTLENRPSIKNSPSAVKGNCGNVVILPKSDVLRKDLVISTPASSVPTPCSLLITRKSQRAARSHT